MKPLHSSTSHESGVLEDGFGFPMSNEELTVGWYALEVDSTFDGNDILCVHILPTFGGKHTWVGDTCICKPRLENYPENASCLIVHKAFNHLSIVT